MIGDVVLNALAAVSGAGASAIVAILVARWLPVEQVGIFGLLTWMVTLGASLATLGAPTTLARYVAEARGQGWHVGGLVRWVLTRHLVFACSAALAVLGLTGAVLGWRLGFMPAAVAIVPVAMAALALSVYRGEQRFRDIALRQFATSLTYVLLVVAVLRAHLGVPGLALALLAQGVVSMLMYVRGLPQEREDPPAGLAARFSALRRNLSMLALVDMVVWQRSEVFFLGVFRSSTDIALYTLPLALVSGLMLVPGSLGGVLLPRVATDPMNRALRNQVYAQGMRYLALATFPLAVGAVLFAEPVIALVLGDAYLPAVRPLQVLAAGSAVTVVASAGSAVLVSEEAVGFMVRWGLVAAALNVGLDLALIPTWGAMGAAIANTGAQLFAVLVTFVYLLSVRRLRVPWKSLARVLIAAGTAGGAARATWPMAEVSGVGGLAVAAGVGLVVFVIAVAIGGELRWVPAALRSARAR